MNNLNLNWNKINTVKRILDENAGNKICTVSFIKKDGTLRPMQLHRSSALESSIKGTRPEANAARKWTLSKNGMMTVEELVKPGSSEHQWRTLNCNTVTSIKIGGQTIRFE